MSAYIEYGDTIAFHPGWYVKEIMDESNLDDEVFAGMLGMTAEELRLVLSGEKDITAYIAVKLSEMLGTSKEFESAEALFICILQIVVKTLFFMKNEFFIFPSSVMK